MSPQFKTSEARVAHVSASGAKTFIGAYRRRTRMAIPPWLLLCALLIGDPSSGSTEGFPVAKCERALPGCTCDDFDELVGVSCTNVSDFSPYARLLAAGSVFEINTTYEVDLSGLRGLGARSLEGLIVFRLTIDDPEFENIAEDAFDGVIRLRRFHVRQSVLQTLPDLRALHDSLRRVVVDRSLLSALSGPELSNLPLLTYLSLSGNRLVEVAANALNGSEAVEVLDLSRNLLETLPTRLFAGLSKLRKLVLTRNRLRHLNGVFEFARPKFIYLDFNNLTDVDGLLYPNMEEVETVLLASNPIANITQHSFNEKVPNLRFLYLDHCLIEHFHVSHYEALHNLSILDLSWNRIRAVGQQKVAFGHSLEIDLMGNQIEDFQAELLFQVKRLYLGGNRLSSLGATLQFVQLAEVSVSHNRLRSLRAEDLHGSHGLQNVQLQGNVLARLDRDAFASLRNDLHNLDLSANRLTSLNGSVRFLSQLKALNASGNLIEAFDPIEFVGLNELSELYLQHNRLLALGGLLEQLPQLQYLVVSTNRLTSVQRRQVPRGLQFLYFRDNPFVCNCQLLPFLEFLDGKSSPTTDVAPCSLLNETSETAASKCPAPCDCRCTLEGSVHFITVECGGKNLSVPPPLFMKKPPSRKDAGVIVVQNSRSPVVWQSVDARFQIQDRALGLDIANNSLDSLDGWRLAPDLRDLFLAHNALRSVPEGALQSLRMLRRVTLSGNPWTCDCGAEPLKKWLLLRDAVVEDVNATTCASLEGSPLSGRLIVTLSDVDLCPADIALYTALGFGLLCFLLVCAALVIAYSRYELHVRVWLYAHGVTWVKRRDLDRDKIFDAFISFSHRDEAFVADEIVAVLESREPNIRLCLHYRHFLPGEFIHQNILNAVQNSKRTVLVLSRNFLESEWCLMEFRAAHLQALEDKVHRIIVIKMADLPKDIDPAIKVYLDSTTYLEWGEKYFWQKLLYALPTDNRGQSNGSVKTNQVI